MRSGYERFRTGVFYLHFCSRFVVAERRCEGVTCVLSYLVAVGTGVNDDVHSRVRRLPRTGEESVAYCNVYNAKVL